MTKTLKNNQIARKNWHETFFHALNCDFDFFQFCIFAICNFMATNCTYTTFDTNLQNIKNQ